MAVAVVCVELYNNQSSAFKEWTSCLGYPWVSDGIVDLTHAFKCRISDPSKLCTISIAIDLLMTSSMLRSEISPKCIEDFGVLHGLMEVQIS